MAGCQVGPGDLTGRPLGKPSALTSQVKMRFRLADSVSMRLVATIMLLSVFSVSCSTERTAWEQGAVQISVERVDVVDEDSLPTLGDTLGWVSRLDYPYCSTYGPIREWEIDGKPNFEFFEDLFDGAQTVDVKAADGAWRLTLAPPVENLNRKAYISCSPHKR